MNNKKNSPLQANDLWKAIILFGLNQASYKMALGKVLVDFAYKEHTEIHWSDLSAAFLDQYIARIERTKMPQQATFGRLTKMERIVSSLSSGILTYDQAVDMVAAEGFGDVVPRFQTVGSDRELVGHTFYEIDFGQKLVLSDSLLSVVSSDANALTNEIEARWSLLEGAFSINHSVEDLQLANDIRETFLKHGAAKRANLTDNIPFLNGYQGNTCFYCGQPISDTPHVDHVLPRQVVMHDHIWNLVLSHSFCNLQKSDKLIGPHFLQKLVYRNENIMGSNHPWKKKIVEQLGNTKIKREKKTKKYYEMVKVARGEVFWGSELAYDPKNDPFYTKLVTVLNNGETYGIQ